MMNLVPRKLDWYIFKRFLLTFFFAMILIIGIVIIFDISEKIDDFVSHEVPLNEIVFKYYLNFVPYFINMFSPLFVFITVIFFTSRLAANSEIIAILSGGISYRRMMVPYMAAAALISLVSLGLNLYVIPRANETRVDFEMKYIHTSSSDKFDWNNIHYQIAPGQFVFVQNFSGWNRTAYKFTLETFEDNKLASKISADAASWDSTNGSWNLKKYFVREYHNGLEETVSYGERIDTTIALTIDDFYRNKKTVETLPYGKLMSMIRTQKMRGDENVMYALIEQQRRWALPFSALILTIMGVALSSKKKRGGIGWNIAVGIGLAFSYILFLRFSEMFVYTGALPPIIALWIPNILFAIIAAVIYRLAPK